MLKQTEGSHAIAEAIIVYRRTREKMPAHDFEVERSATARKPPAISTFGFPETI